MILNESLCRGKGISGKGFHLYTKKHFQRDDGNMVIVYINRIRDKIEEDKRNPKIIESVRGIV